MEDPSAPGPSPAAVPSAPPPAPPRPRPRPSPAAAATSLPASTPSVPIAAATLLSPEAAPEPPPVAATLLSPAASSEVTLLPAPTVPRFPKGPPEVPPPPVAAALPSAEVSPETAPDSLPNAPTVLAPGADPGPPPRARVLGSLSYDGAASGSRPLAIGLAPPPMDRVSSLGVMPPPPMDRVSSLGVMPPPPTDAIASSLAAGGVPPAGFPLAPVWSPSEAAPPSGPGGPPEAYAPGNLIAGKYELRSVLGRGGMGSVWLAHNLTLDIDVAIKLIRRDRAGPDLGGRLLQEARATARLGHPSIVRVFDFGQSEYGDPFIVMEVLRGESLTTALERRGRLPPLLAAQTLLPVASALVAAHAKGIVHRDLKPDNILLTREDGGALTPKVVDFGIAKLLNADVERRFTLAGEVLGSPDYMSPEQARGLEDVGEGADIWAFSVIFYELVTGRRPFDAPNYNSLILAIIMEDPMPIRELGVADDALWAILERGLAKDVENRFQTMREMGMALATWALERGVEEDVAGTSLSAHWQAVGPRRTLSEFPRESRGPAFGDRQSLEAGALSKRAVADFNTLRPPFAPRRGRWIAGVAVALVAGTGLLLGREPIAALFGATAPAASSAKESGSATAAPPVVVPPPAPTATVAVSAASPSVSATASAVPVVRRPKRTAPPVPKGISF
jgi:eukaryotic-like serine/threonine-protein kinase